MNFQEGDKAVMIDSRGQRTDGFVRFLDERQPLFVTKLYDEYGVPFSHNGTIYGQGHIKGRVRRRK